MTAGSGIVVGIDPSPTSSGVAQFHWGAPVALNTFGQKLHEQASYAARAERMTFTLAQVLQAVPRTAELIVMEGMAYNAGGTDGHHRHTDPDVIGLWWHIFTHLNARGTAIAVIPPLTLKVWATGKAAEKINGRMVRTDKTDMHMLDEARAQFPDQTIRNADIADALHAATCGAAYLGHPLPFTRRRDRFNLK